MTVLLETGFPVLFKQRRINFSVTPVVFPVMFSDGAQHPAGIPHCHHISRNVPRHDASGSDDAVVTDGHTGHDDDTGTQPAVPALWY